jgi:hypothetical protein
MVPHLDEFELIPMCGACVVPDEVLSEFDLERRESTLHHRVVVAVPPAVHAHAAVVRRDAGAIGPALRLRQRRSAAQALYDEARRAGVPVVFNNAYRDRAQLPTGGRPGAGNRSQHLAGFAFDINSSMMTAAQNSQFSALVFGRGAGRSMVNASSASSVEVVGHEFLHAAGAYYQEAESGVRGACALDAPWGWDKGCTDLLSQIYEEIEASRRIEEEKRKKSKEEKTK